MSTERPGKAGESGDLVLCSLKVSGVRVQRDQADELAGWPIGCTSQLYDELGAPYQHCSFLLPKRTLLVSGTIEARKESGVTTAELPLDKAVASSMRFSLDVPDDQGPTVVVSFTLAWNAGGDEVDEVKHLLRDRCFLVATFSEPQLQLLTRESKASKKEEQAAGHRNRLDRKRQAAGEREDDDEPVARIQPVAPEPAPKAKTAKKKGGGLAQLQKEAEEIARRHPRREPPKKNASQQRGKGRR